MNSTTLIANYLVPPALVAGGAYLAGRFGYQVVTPMSAFIISSTGNSLAFQTHQTTKNIFLSFGIVPAGVVVGRIVRSGMLKIPAPEVLSGRGVLIISAVLIACKLAIHFFSSPAGSRRSMAGSPQLLTPAQLTEMARRQQDSRQRQRLVTE